MPLPIQRDSINEDLSARIQVTTTSPSNPSSAAETVILTLTISRFTDMAVVSGIQVSGWVALTIAGSGVSLQLRLRQTSVSGTIIGNTGALTGGIAAGNLVAQDVEGFDSGAGVGVYVLTGQVASGSGASTVSAAMLRATII